MAEYLNQIYLVAILVAAIAGTVFGFYFRVYLDRQIQSSAHGEAKKVVDSAKHEAERIRKQAELEGKEAIYKERMVLEREVSDRRNEIKTIEQRLQHKEDQLDAKLEKLTDQQQELADKKEKLGKQEQELQGLILHQREELEKVSGLTAKDAKQMLISNVEEEAKYEANKVVKRIEEEAKRVADKRARRIVTLAIQRIASEQTAEISVSVLNIPSEEMKGRIIGREGRNIREFERVTGVDVIIDDTPDAVVLSAFDPVRREIARLSLERLITDGRIHPGRIEQVVKKVQQEMEKVLVEAGDQAIYEVGLTGMPEDELRLLGRLKYRTSFGQNVLQHSLEVAHLAGIMAAELGANVTMAKRVGLLHDIGKAIDQETEGSHASIGAAEARKAGEAEPVIQAIAAHHGEAEVTSVEAVLIQAADAISAARPGARRENIENYLKRLEKLERISMSFRGVEKSYAIQAGRELRVMVHAEQLKDEETDILARELAARIEQEVDYPGQIKVTVIREHRVVEYAK